MCLATAWIPGLFFSAPCATRHEALHYSNTHYFTLAAFEFQIFKLSMKKRKRKWNVSQLYQVLLWPDRSLWSSVYLSYALRYFVLWSIELYNVTTGWGVIIVKGSLKWTLPYIGCYEALSEALLLLPSQLCVGLWHQAMGMHIAVRTSLRLFFTLLVIYAAHLLSQCWFSYKFSEHDVIFSQNLDGVSEYICELNRILLIYFMYFCNSLLSTGIAFGDIWWYRWKHWSTFV